MPSLGGRPRVYRGIEDNYLRLSCVNERWELPDRYYGVQDDVFH